MEPVPVCRDIALDETSLRLRQITDEMSEFTDFLAGQPVEDRLRNLQKTVQQIGLTPPRRPPRLERYVVEWGQFKTGKRKVLDRSTAAYLCWEPEAATDSAFLCHLIASKFNLTSRSLAGLVRSSHNSWSGPFPTSLSADIIRGLLCRYQGSNPVVSKWKTNNDIMLGINAHSVLGRRLNDEKKKIQSLFDEWFLESSSPFAHSVIENATALCRTQLVSPSRDTIEFLFAELLSWPEWNPAAFRREIGQLIMDGAATGQIREILQKFILLHKELGDPRLPGNQLKWMDVGEAPKTRVLRWLAKTPYSFVEHIHQEGRGWSWRQREEMSS